MKFSVLMSLYTKEQPDFLNDCLNSLVNQTVLASEIVVVFDGPIPIELSHTIQRFIPTLPLKIIELKENVGLGKALNQGLSHCTHEWVFRMDTDDICHPERFEKQINYITQHQDIVVLGSQIIEFRQSFDDSHIIKQVPCTYEDIKFFAKTRCPFNHMSVAYKKDVILNVGGYEHHLFMEDYNLWLRILSQNYQVANLPDVLVYARVGNGMHARRKGISYIRSEKQLLDLKIKLQIQSLLPAYFAFLIRSSTRLLPASVLGFFYNKILRKSTNS